jgi:hypothetical protein
MEDEPPTPASAYTLATIGEARLVPPTMYQPVEHDGAFPVH